MPRVSAPDTALIISTVASPVVAVVVSYIGYRSARAVATTAAETERERITSEMTKDHDAWLMEQRRNAYIEANTLMRNLSSALHEDELSYETYMELWNKTIEVEAAVVLFAPRSVGDLMEDCAAQTLDLLTARYELDEEALADESTQYRESDVYKQYVSLRDSCYDVNWDETIYAMADDLQGITRDAEPAEPKAPLASP
jgi:hypothetical protein